MKQNSFPSREELLLQCNTIKQRQERIIQVRQQSKQMSAEILEKVKKEAQKQCEEIENKVLSEIRNYHQKELENSRKQYEKCISEINQRHYSQLVNEKSISSRISNKNKVRHLSPMKSATSISNNPKVEKPPEKKSTVEPSEKRTSTVKIPNKKLNDKKVKPVNKQKNSHNIVIDSDTDEVRKHVILNFRKHSPEVKQLKSLHSENEIRSRSKCRGKSHCPNDPKFRLIHQKSKEDHVIPNDKLSKTQIDEMYNHLVHERIRILEQKDKILDRQTMFLPAGAVMANKPPRFSEYFANFRSKNISPTKTIATVQSNISRSDSEMNEILEDMKRIEMKKKSLRSELTKSNDAIHSKTVSLSEEKQTEKKQDSPRNSEKPTTNSNSNKNSLASNSSDSSSKKTPPQNVLCPSPITKVTHDNDNSPESDQKEKLPLKRRPCKRKLRSKEIQVTVSNGRKSVTVGSSNTVVNTPPNNTSSSSSTHKDFHQKTTAPVKLVVNVLPSTDCTIEIKSNAADKRYLNCTSERNTEKVKDWRTLFKNQEKLTESSYFSPPEYEKKIQATSSEEHNEQVLPSADTNDIGYYVRKLLMMSPESVDDLDVSSCDTTLIKDISRNISSDSNPTNKISSGKRLPKRNQFIDPESQIDDSENARKLLLECLKLATAEADDINLTTFKSVDSSCDKMFDNLSTAPELNDSNISCRNFINTAIQRLLPLYQNSLDDNLDCTTQSQRILNFFENQCEAEESKDNSTFISPSAYLQKFVSSLSGTSEKPEKNYDIIESLKQYIESQSSSDKSNKISEDSFDHADNVVSKDESCFSLPSVDELIRKGLISKTYTQNDTQNEPKIFLSEEEFIKKMLQTDLISKESHPKEDSGQSESNNNSGNHQSDMDERYTTDIRKEFRKLGLNWMDTTLQRTLQASAINSTSSTEDSAGPLRNNSKFSSNYRPSISSSLNVPSQQPKQPSRELLNISPIKIPDLQLSLPQCFQKN